MKLGKTAALSFTVLVVAIAVGALLSSQYRTPLIRQRVSEADALVSLISTRDHLQAKQDLLEAEISNSKARINEVEDQLKSIVDEEDQRYLDHLKEMVGLTDLRGRGLVITLNSSSGDTGEGTAYSSDVRDIINSLWGSGAVALSVNGQRVVGSTAISGAGTISLINSRRTTAPFVINVIGPEEIATTLEQDPRLEDLRQRSRDYGLIFYWEAFNEVYTPAFDGSFPLEFAKIAPKESI